jgi:DNA processing protein
VSGVISDSERRDRLRLARTDTVGPVTYAALMARYGSAAKALDALPRLAARGGRAAALTPTSVAQAEREIEAGDRLGAVLITAGEAAFPRPLAAIDPPPPVLWLRGQPALTLKPAVAIVGARHAGDHDIARLAQVGCERPGEALGGGGGDARAHDRHRRLQGQGWLTAQP